MSLGVFIASFFVANVFKRLSYSSKALHHFNNQKESMPFTSLGLHTNILRAISAANYTAPTPIQQAAIPAILQGRDLLAAAQTGTGKTASFVLPILNQLLAKEIPVKKEGIAKPVLVLILTPTRELAAQISANIETYSQFVKTQIKHTVVFGGVSINPQMQKLRGGVDILVATPGRLLDLVGQNAVKLNAVEVLVLDEADRMLDMGFARDLKKIMALLPKKRQNLLFSATFNADIKNIASAILHDPTLINVAPENTTVERIEQLIYQVNKSEKTAVLTHLIKQNNWHQVLVFMAMKHECNHLVEKLAKSGITAAAIHGNKSQGARTSALANFKDNKIQVLVATDVAARGIDINLLPYVVNFSLPKVPADYVHRIGRTGRAGQSGLAVSLVSPDEMSQLRSIEKLISLDLPKAELADFPLLKGAAANVPEPSPPRKPQPPRHANRDNKRAESTAKANAAKKNKDLRRPR